MKLPGYPQTYNELDLANGRYTGLRSSSICLELSGQDVGASDPNNFMELGLLIRDKITSNASPLTFAQISPIKAKGLKLEDMIKSIDGHFRYEFSKPYIPHDSDRFYGDIVFEGGGTHLRFYTEYNPTLYATLAREDFFKDDNAKDTFSVSMINVLWNAEVQEREIMYRFLYKGKVTTLSIPYKEALQIDPAVLDTFSMPRYSKSAREYAPFVSFVQKYAANWFERQREEKEQPEKEGLGKCILPYPSSSSFRSIAARFARWFSGTGEDDAPKLEDKAVEPEKKPALANFKVAVVCDDHLMDCIKTDLSGDSYNPYQHYTIREAKRSIIKGCNLIIYVNDTGFHIEHVYPDVRSIHRRNPGLPIYIDLGVDVESSRAGYGGERIKQLMDCNVIGYSVEVSAPDLLSSERLAEVFSERSARLMRRYFHGTFTHFFPNLQSQLDRVNAG